MVIEAFDVVAIHLYLFAIFTTLVKQKTSIKMYRLLKFFVVVLFGILLYVLIRDNGELDRVMIGIRFIPIVLVIVIMIQTEAKLIIKYIGVKTGLLLVNAIEEDVKEEIMDAILYLSKHKIGALITFERDDSLADFIQTAFLIDAPVRSELLTTIFTPLTPLHDGAVIIRGNSMMCAGTYFPPSENPDIPKTLGSRHRAAIGISEVCDALTIVVSEQTGAFSVTVNGFLDYDISKDSLLLYLEKYLQN